MHPSFQHPEWLEFVAAIRQNQADDTRRLVAADWLQEHDLEPYAQFIRLQIDRSQQNQSYRARRVVPADAMFHVKCARDRDDPNSLESAGECRRCAWERFYRDTPNRVKSLKRQEFALLKKHGGDWVPRGATRHHDKFTQGTSFRRPKARVFFERGFVSMILFVRADYVPSTDELVAAQPVTRITAVAAVEYLLRGYYKTGSGNPRISVERFLRDRWPHTSSWFVDEPAPWPALDEDQDNIDF